MHCPRCGAENDDKNTKCRECGGELLSAQPHHTPVERPPAEMPAVERPAAVSAETPVQPPRPGPVEKLETYLIHNILTTILCCLPFGIVGIIFSSQAKKKLESGDHAGAVAEANKAKMWFYIALFSGLAVVVIHVVVIVFLFATKTQSGAGGPDVY